MWSRLTGLLLLLLWISPGLVHADVRVLFGFDETGVHVHRVIDMESRSDFATRLLDDAQADVLSRRIRLRWLGAEERLLATTLTADPRIVQAPNHANASQLSRMGLNSGGWVATGPDDAISVVVYLPERPELALAAETWTLSLSGEN